MVLGAQYIFGKVLVFGAQYFFWGTSQRLGVSQKVTNGDRGEGGGSGLFSKPWWHHFWTAPNRLPFVWGKSYFWGENHDKWCSNLWLSWETFPIKTWVELLNCQTLFICPACGSFWKMQLDFLLAQSANINRGSQLLFLRRFGFQSIIENKICS